MSRLKAVIFIAMLWYAQGASAQKYDGLASFYSSECHGKKTADGKTYNMYEYTCAHKSLPIGTMVRVTNLNNNRSIVVTVTDRGPYSGNRVLDLSAAAARELNFLHKGVVPVAIDVVKDGSKLRDFTVATDVLPFGFEDRFKLYVKLSEKAFRFPNLLHGHRVS